MGFALSKRPHFHRSYLVTVSEYLSLVVDRVNLSQDYIPSKSCYDLGLLAPNIDDLDFSNEVLNIHFGQEVAKKIRGRSWRSKKILPTLPDSTPTRQASLSWQI